MVVFRLPSADEVAGVTNAAEPVLVEAFIAQAAVEALCIGVLDRLSGSDEAQSNAALICPRIKNAASELRAVVHGDRCW